MAFPSRARTSRLLRILRFHNQLIHYQEALAQQVHLAEERREQRIPDTLLILQHPPVFTIGKRGKESDFRIPIETLRQRGIDIHHVPRGGETTFHGPGQIVAYPIVDLRQLGYGARRYVETLEDVMIQTLAQYRIRAMGRMPGETGVWVVDNDATRTASSSSSSSSSTPPSPPSSRRKIGAVGVQISNGVTTHGIALNVTTKMEHFDMIIPCGVTDKAMTSLEMEARGTNQVIKYEDAEDLLARVFAEQFGYEEVETR